MEKEDQFLFYKKSHLAGVTLLDASISTFKYKRHTHDDYSIGVTMSGYQNFFCNGDYFRVPRGGVIQINPDESHDGFAEDEAGYSYFMMYVSRSLIHEAIGAHTSQKVRDFRFIHTMIAHPELRARLFGLIQYMKHHGQDPLLFEELFLKMVEVAVHANTSMTRSGIQTSNRDSLILRAKDYIHDHLQQNISLDEISQMLNLSKYHFVRLFKEQMGTTPYQYMLDCKINAARKDLEQRLDLGEVMERYGFYDQSHFNRRFKEMYGATPHEFQKSILE